MKTKSIKQSVTFDASPAIVYDLVMDSGKHVAFTGSRATMSQARNGKFTVYDGYCHGHNLELIPGKKIVQAWHFAEDGWPDDHFSTCTFLFEPSGKKTKLVFEQKGVPEHKVEALKNGWKQYYWQPMKTYLKNN
jgi:activator of HSP90 ATPase